MSTYLEIVPLLNGQEKNSKFTSSIRCYDLAMMLVDWEQYHYLDYSDKLTPDDVDILRSTYGKESISVQEGFEEHKPNIVSTYKLIGALERLKNQVLYPVLKDSVLNGKLNQLPTLTQDLMVISECIGALNYIKHEINEVYLAIEDC